MFVSAGKPEEAGHVPEAAPGVEVGVETGWVGAGEA
jgi:hypothetical protein